MTAKPDEPGKPRKPSKPSKASKPSKSGAGFWGISYVLMEPYLKRFERYFKDLGPELSKAGLRITIPTTAVRGIDAQDSDRSLEELARAGAEVV